MKEINRNEDIIMLIKKEKKNNEKPKKYTFKEKGWYFKVVNRKW